MHPQLRYSLFYFAVNLSSAANLAFFPLHCKNLGFTPMQIALASAASSFATFFSAPGFTWLSHHHVPPRKILLTCSMLSCVLYLPLLFVQSFSMLMPVWLCYLLLYSATSVIVDTRAVRESAAFEIVFERARLWGSLGFITSIALIGILIDIFGIGAIVRLGMLFACLTFGGACLLLDRMPEQRGSEIHAKTAAANSAPPRGPLLIVLVAVALIWASHGAFYVYFSIYAKALGWSGTQISVAWNIGVISEVLLFIAFPRLTELFSLGAIFRFSAFVTIVRWVFIALVTNPIALVIIQILHAFTFGSLYLSSIHLVQKISPPSFRERGQGLLTGFSSGGGSLAGRLIFGLCASAIPLSEDLYLLFWPAAFLAVGGFFISLFFREEMSATIPAHEV